MKVREELIQTTSKLFHEQGYNATGRNQIIDEASIAKGSFYYNFKSKEELCIAFLDFHHQYCFSKPREYIEAHVGQKR